MKKFLRWLLRLLYGFRAYNEGVVATPGPVLLLPNHVSWWDWLLIGVCLDDDWRFVTSSTAAEVSWIHKRIMVNRRTFPVDIQSPFAVKRMAEYLQRGGRLVLFPEGQLSRTGSLMKLFDGTGFLINKTKPRVITAYLRGANRLPFGRSPGFKEWFPRLSVHFSPALGMPEQKDVKPAAARARLMAGLRDQMIEQQFETEMQFGPSTLPEAIADAARGRNAKVVMEDATRQELTYARFRLGADLLAKQWRRLLDRAERRVGVLLPNVNAMPVTLLSLWLADKAPAILNYSSGPAVMLACAQLAGLKQIITSKTFRDRFKLDLAPFEAAGIKILFLEEVRTRITTVEKLSTSLLHFLNLQPATCNLQPNDVAAVLFTSGSEGNPKGVQLTHRNLLANIRQMVSVIDLMETDRFFNALPLFHSFGLTVGLLLPLTRGVFVFLYPSPLHYRVVPASFYNLDCTVLFGTNTFLAGYARKAHPYDFRAMRYLFGAGEKIQEATMSVWMRKFGVRILEGYGATECSPCLSANLPMYPRDGSVGQFLPGVEYKLEAVEGVNDDGGNRNEDALKDKSEGRTLKPEPNQSLLTSAPTIPGRVGRLFVRGPNVMLGYVNPEANASLKALDGWYDTGDIVKVDQDGFVFILGRLKRFAKVSGEMVSLTAVEDALAGAFPQYGLKFAVAVIARPDEAKGERLVAVTNEPKLKLEEVRDVIRARGLNNLAVPREIKVVREIPRLGTGKVNHRELEKMEEVKHET
jgi:acyl-[acyl-carrier-protein]-phospholipid O-acyltransferase/long-chain-fatty-acid--[acyl-carrier-protein] ligase